MGRIHHSADKGRAFLHAVYRLGNGATTGALMVAVGDRLPNNCAAYARRVLDDAGVADPKTTVTARQISTMSDGSRVYLYELREDVRRMIADGLLDGKGVHVDMFAAGGSR